jgi:hypothetical protein
VIWKSWNLAGSMANVTALEVMPALNSRSEFGRVVVDPPSSKLVNCSLRESV